MSDRVPKTVLKEDFMLSLTHVRFADPKLELLGNDGLPIPGEPVTEAIKILKNGGVLAVKGIGGFHLAVDGA